MCITDPSIKNKSLWKLFENSSCVHVFQMFCSSHIFVVWFWVFWSLQLRDFLSVFFHHAHLALQNVNKEYVIFLYFRNSNAKSDEKQKTKYGINETFEMNWRDLCDTAEFWMLWTLEKNKRRKKNMNWSFVPWWTQNDTATKCVFNFISSFLGGDLTFKRLCQKDTALSKETCFSSRMSCLKK